MPNVEYVSSGKVHQLPEIVDKVRSIHAGDQPIYLVGGAVRDLLLQQPVSDFDFILPGKAISLARKVDVAIEASSNSVSHLPQSLTCL
jgi:tRNA nucleotidyltransferase/poly(A) polymerase